MKTKSALSLLILFLVSFPVFSQSSINGQWTINREKSALPSDQLFLSKIKFEIKGDTLLSTRTYQSPDGQEYPFDEKLTLDGKENKITIFEMPRVSKATKGENGNILIESKTTFYGNGGEENLFAREIWNADGNGLSMRFTNTMAGQEFTGTFYYNR